MRLPPYEHTTRLVGSIHAPAHPRFTHAHALAGHGQRLIRAAYALARQRDIVFEITVEDPCPSFASLRAVTDTQDLHRLCEVGWATGCPHVYVRCDALNNRGVTELSIFVLR